MLLLFKFDNEALCVRCVATKLGA